MISKKEISYFLAASLVLALAISLMASINAFLWSLLAVALVFAVNIIAKKIFAYQLDSKINIQLWEMKRWGFKKHHHLDKPFPLGLILPIITSAITLGKLVWLSPFTFEVEPETYRAAKRHGLYKFSEMTEWHIGLIAAAGILANLIFAVLGYFIGFSLFAKLNILYAFFNMLPISSLDGNKIFFGSMTLWSFLAALTLVAVGYLILLV